MTTNDRPRPTPAYTNAAFLDSDDGRALRILAEHLEPLQAFRREGIRDTMAQRWCTQH